jgi:alpha-L-fucosidase
MKPATQLIQNLVTCASNGGNYLLNIGPKPDGGIRKDEALRLKEIGRWMKKNGEAIYGTERLPSGSAWEATGFGFWGAGMLGMATAKGNNAYLHIFRWPGSTAVITGIGSRVLSAEILASGKKLRFKHEQGKLVITGMPSQPPDKHGTVIKLKLKGRAETFDYAGLPLPE